MPASTSPEKIALIEAQGGVVPPGRRPDDDRTTRRSGSRPSATGTSSTSSPTPSARPTGAATTTSPSRSSARWRWSDTPFPAWIVVGAGTGGTSATIGRYARFGRYPTRLCVVDPEDSIFYSSWTRRPVGVHRPAVAHRGHRTPARRAVVPAGHRRPHDPGSGCRVDRDDAARARAHGTQRRRLHRDERLGRVRCSSPRCSRVASAAASSP